MDELYSLYSQSYKNENDIKSCAQELDAVFHTIGRVLDVRWAASSFRAAKAVWDSFQALYAHFTSEKCNKRHASKFTGLAKTLASPEFVQNLATMLDALDEVKKLSLALQDRNVSLVTAHKLIEQTIQTMENMVDTPGNYLEQALNGVSDGIFSNVKLKSNKAVREIRPSQLFRSLANSLQSRMMTVCSRRGETAATTGQYTSDYLALLNDISILEKDRWPINYQSIPAFGEKSIRSLCKRFGIDDEKPLVGFKKMKTGKKADAGIELLQLALHCIPVSTAECERSFSCMNTILTKKRNRLNIDSLSSLMFISIVGPSVRQFNPTPFAKRWLKRGQRSAARCYR